MKTAKQILALFLSLSLLLSLSACGGKSGTGAASDSDVLNPPDPDPVADALAAYRPILEQAASYFTEDEDANYINDATVTYRYALVQLQAGCPIPALVLEQEALSDFWGYLCNALVFQYDPDSQIVIQGEERLNEGVSGAGGYRGTLSLSENQLSILETYWSSGTGMGSIRQVSVEWDGFRFETIFDGFLFDESVQIVTLPIDWYDIGNLSALEGWVPSEISQPEQ